MQWLYSPTSFCINVFNWKMFSRRLYMCNSFTLSLGVILLLSVSNQAHTAVSPEKLSQLDTQLTPLGAERGGNEEGTIPEWLKDKEQIDRISKSIIDEASLFTITAANAGQFSQKLSDGQKALLATYPESYRIPVYSSQRLHNAPQWLYEATRRNGLEAKLIDEGNGLTNVWPGLPFPIPNNGLEILWNHLASWRGIYATIQYTEATIRPSGSTSIIRSRMELAMPYYEPLRDKITGNSVLSYYLTLTLSPARLAGGAVLVHDPLNPRLDSRKVWIYNASQRRVRRLPAFDYDTPNMNSEHIKVVDEINLFNGAPDRYNWSLVGKREIYIPYNSNALAKQTSNFDKLLTPHHLPPEATRNELHRVWVLEGRLKPGEHHIYSRRVFYLDEDSWMVIIAENYDRHDKLWRVNLAHTRYYPELPGVMLIMYVHHDLKEETYYVQAITSDERNDIKFSNKLPPKKYFLPSSLRRKVKR